VADIKEINSVDLSEPGIAVILNAWEELTKPIHQVCFNTTLDVIVNRPEITAVFLAATHVDLNKNNQGPNLWFDNAERIFFTEQGVDWVRRFWKVEKNKTFAHHNPLIRDHNYQGKLCIALWEQWELEYLLNFQYPHVRNIWYFGSGLGVRRDPMGWGQLCYLIKYKHVEPLNILAHKNGITVNNKDTSDFKTCTFTFPDWENGWNNFVQINDDIFCKQDLDW